MENLILLLTASLVYYKSAKQIKRVRIGKTPCSVIIPASTEFHTAYTEAGDRLYFAEFNQNHSRYGVIFGVLTEQLNYEESYDLLTNYMNDLREPLYAAHNTGITDVDKRRTRFIELEDFWQDEDGTDWEVKGYTNGKYVAVLYVRNINEATSMQQEAFLNSFSFGE